jgi:hypothetical protein
MMNGLRHHIGAALRLHFRNRMALLYGYLFPTIFLVAFWVLYRYERVPLVRHIGELLTVTVLGGACFGLPTTLVSERERGVWRRYRLAPVSTGVLLTGTVIARYVLLITAGALQLVLAMAIGMPRPPHPLELWIAFTCVAFAFLGLGLVVAMLADNVPAVQALGQSIFLPMLILGGIAVPIGSLPKWSQHLAAFFPGLYAVDALRACVTGDGLGSARFSLFALLLIGAAGCLAGARMFRWDAQQRFASIEGKGWIAAALGAWIAVGAVHESGLRIAFVSPARVEDRAVPPPAPTGATPPVPAAPTPTPSSPRPKVGAAAAALDRATAPPGSAKNAFRPPRTGTSSTTTTSRNARTRPSTSGEGSSALAPTTASSWREVTVEEIDRQIDFTRLPPDDGIVTPIASSSSEEPDADTAERLEVLRVKLPDWQPGHVDDSVQRVRNYLYVAAVPDVLQEPLERFAPHVVFERLEADIPKDQLVQILFWIALHPYDGDDGAVNLLTFVGLDAPGDRTQTRDRVAFYAVKLLGRLLGRISPG